MTIQRPHVVGTTEYSAERVAIAEIIAAYGLFYDTGQWEAFADLFSEDATYNITPDPKLIPLPLAGREAIKAEMSNRRRISGDEVFPRHLATNLVFHHIDGDYAGASSFLVVVFTYLDGRIETRRAGTYVDEFRKQEGRWRFAGRHLKLDTAAPPPSR